jgi:hypothetical protein
LLSALSCTHISLGEYFREQPCQDLPTAGFKTYSCSTWLMLMISWAKKLHQTQHPWLKDVIYLPTVADHMLRENVLHVSFPHSSLISPDGTAYLTPETKTSGLAWAISCNYKILLCQLLWVSNLHQMSGLPQSWQAIDCEPYCS